MLYWGMTKTRKTGGQTEEASIGLEMDGSLDLIMLNNSCLKNEQNKS